MESTDGPTPIEEEPCEAARQRQAVIVVQPNDQVGKRARFEAMQKLIRPKEEKPRE